jgi:hypothetical protein
MAELVPTAVREPRAPSPTSEPTASAAPSFGMRTTVFARTAVDAARQRRATLAALLAVALFSASVGVLAGRWLAARTGATAAEVRR